jgi:hypothetical protein
MEQILTAEELRSDIKKVLEEKGCTKISFPDKKDDLVVVVFDSQNFFDDKIIPNFLGWSRSGILVNKDSTLNHQYKIDYKKNSN